MRESIVASTCLHLILIKPTHYDDDGYPIQWMISAIPSNTLAALNGLAEDCRARQILGPDVDIKISTYDETNARVDPPRLIREIRRSGDRALIALVGVQTNQFPRAMDLARRFRAEGIAVALGGFHVSGCISMLNESPADIRAAQDLGVSLFAGEAEERRLDEVLRDAYAGALKPLYNWMSDLPSIAGEPAPILPAKHISRTAGSHSSFDLGRGCPFQCSFCTIINVQGRKSRFRTPDDLETIIRENYAQGIRKFFITDDNFARNKDWEAFIDRLIELRYEEGIWIKLVIQVDTLCHRIPHFIEKCASAGVSRVFIGLENINPDNLIAAKKRQNKITEYREMLQAWKRHRATTYAGYILGFPGDTYDSIMRDIEIIKRELPLDLLEFFFLTPLPGSEDHKKLHEAEVWMDPDMNKYDLNHRCAHHPTMSDAEWERAYRDAWSAFYTKEHMVTVMRRFATSGRHPRSVMFLLMWFAGCVPIHNIHPLEGGFIRRKSRRDRRPTFPIESRWTFYPKFAWELIRDHVRWARLYLSLLPACIRIRRDENRREYMDLSLSPVDDEGLEDMRIVAETRGGVAALERSRRLKGATRGENATERKQSA